MPMVTLPGGDLRDEIRQPLYDTVKLVAGDVLAGVRSFFTSINRATGARKTLAETNSDQYGQPGQLATATSFRVQGLAFDAAQDSLLNTEVLQIIMNKSSLNLTIAQKIYWQGPTRYAAGRMVQSSSAGTVAATAGLLFQEYGWPAIQPIVFQGRHTLDILPVQNFFVQWVTDASNLTAAENSVAIGTATEIAFVCSLKGLLRRPVQ